MQHKEIVEYSVIHKLDGSTQINLFFEDGVRHSLSNLDPARALLLVDLLRNEKPMFWSKGPNIIWTGREPVGEGEISQEGETAEEGEISKGN